VLFVNQRHKQFRKNLAYSIAMITLKPYNSLQVINKCDQVITERSYQI
jgi:hypothetical protein